MEEDATYAYRYAVANSHLSVWFRNDKGLGFKKLSY